MTATYKGKPLSECSVQELKEFKDGLNEQILVQKEKEARTALADIAKIVKGNNLIISEILRVLKNSNAIKFSASESDEPQTVYYNPKNPLELYAGMGRKPNWLVEMEEEGIDYTQYSFIG